MVPKRQASPVEAISLSDASPQQVMTSVTFVITLVISKERCMMFSAAFVSLSSLCVC